MADRTAKAKAALLLEQGGTDEQVETATGLSLTEIIGLRAERAARTESCAPSRTGDYLGARRPYVGHQWR